MAIFSIIAKRYLEGRPKLISYLVHASEFPLQNSEVKAVRTHSIVIRNAGKQSAHNVRVGHNHLPQSYQIYPAVAHEVNNSPCGASEIVFPTLVPNEQVSISYLYFPDIFWHQINTYTKSDEGMAKVVNIIPSPQLPKWKAGLLLTFMFVGASTILYWAVLAIYYWVP